MKLPFSRDNLAGTPCRAEDAGVHPASATANRVFPGYATSRESRSHRADARSPRTIPARGTRPTRTRCSRPAGRPRGRIVERLLQLSQRQFASDVRKDPARSPYQPPSPCDTRRTGPFRKRIARRRAASPGMPKIEGRNIQRPHPPRQRLKLIFGQSKRRHSPGLPF